MSAQAAVLAAMHRMAQLLTGALLSEDGDAFLRYHGHALALAAEWRMTDDMIAWAHDEAALNAAVD